MQLRKASSWFRQPLVGFASLALAPPAPRRLLQLRAGSASPAMALPPPRWFRHLHVGSATPALVAPAPRWLLQPRVGLAIPALASPASRWFRQSPLGFATSTLVPPAPRWFRQPRAGFATSTSVPPAPQPDAVLAIEASIAKLTASVVALEKELKMAKAALEPWDNKFLVEAALGQILPTTDSMVTRLSAKVDAAQAALDKANALLLEEKKLLDSEKNRELEREKLAAESDGQIRIPKFSPPPTFVSKRYVDFVTSKQWTTIYDELLKLATDLPTSDFRGLPYPVVYGIMGCGKSTAAWRAITQVCEALPDKKYIPCYLRVDNLEALFPAFKTETSSVNVLATVLLSCFTNLLVGVHGSLSLKQVGERAVKSYGSTNFFLHIDEFQSSPDVTKQLILACRETIRSDLYGICVVPIVSGIPDLDFPIEASQWPMMDVQLGPLPAEKLWESFLTAVGVPFCPFGEYKNLSILFNDCGAYASQVVSLTKMIKREYPQLSGDLTSAEAWNVYDKTLSLIQGVYSWRRWHSIFSSTSEVNGKLSSYHPSWPNTKGIIKQVMLFVLTQKAIPNMAQEVVPGITWERCKLTGMVDFVPKDNGWTAKCSLFALFVMNDMAQVIPPVARLNNAFDNGWQAHERIALVSFMLHLKVHEAGKSVSLKECRPGAYIQTDVEVKIEVPQDTTYRPEEKGLTVGTDLTVGNVLLTADSEAGVDGVMLFNGSVDDKPRKILVLSQSKKRGNSIVGGVNTGEVSTKEAKTSQVAPLLHLMRAAKAKLPPNVQDAFVVFDLFTDWIGPVNNWQASGLVLQANEALIITESKTLDLALGGLVGIKREVPKYFQQR